MCVATAMPVSHAAGLIRSSQLFPPFRLALSNVVPPSHKAQPFHYVDRNYRNFPHPLAVRPKRRPHATILERSSRTGRLSCVALLVSCLPVACPAIPLSNDTSLDSRVQAVNPLNGSLC